MDAQTSLDLYVVCGEASGDLLGYELLKDIADKISIRGVRGAALKTLPIQEDFTIDDFSINGFISVITHLPSIARKFLKLKKTILSTNPKAVLLIDFSDFNLLLGKSLKKAGYRGKIIQMVLPSIWAWRKKRKETLEKYFDHLFCIFPFETALFENSAVKAYYIGHPLASKLADYKMTQTEKPEKPLIALFPGSRTKEIKLNLPLMLNALSSYQKTHQFALCLSNPKHRSLVNEITKESNLPIQITTSFDRYTLMEKTTLALAKSGTINLELALMNVPTICTYKMPLIEELLARHLFKIILPNYSIVNILAQKRIIPELIGPVARQDHLNAELKHLLESKRAREEQNQAFAEIKKSLSPERLLKNPTDLLLEILSI